MSQALHGDFMKVVFPAVLGMFFVLLNAFFPLPADAAEESGCVTAAREWIVELKDRGNEALLLRYARNDCRFAAKWMAGNPGSGASGARRRLCNDLVLIWAHKDCGYFRDHVNPDAYDPCKAWTRRMFRRCMDDDRAWFGATAETVQAE